MGELFSLGSAVVWALAVILLKRSMDRVSAFALNLYRVVASCFFFGATFALLGQPPWREAPPGDYAILLASGIIGIAVSDTLFHKGLDLLGAGLTAIVDCLYSPFVVGLAFFALGERIGAWQYAGMVLVIAGVLVAAQASPPPGATRRRLAAGFAYGALSMLTVAIGIVIAKQVLERSPVLWATAVRQVGALCVLLPAALLSPHRRRYFDVLRPQAHWRDLAPGAFLGSYAALMLWIAGMKHTQAGAAAIINQSSTIFVLVLATLLLKETFARRKALACALAFGGIVLVTFG